MKLKESPYQTETSGDFKNISFQISENTEDQGLIFEILRSKMYSNPIGSICREIASNSRDANREVGKGEIPIEVEILEPNSLLNISDLCICFRDNGPGISPDRMINIYSKYASSTKRNTNNQVGGFGLGAKTPMAYSDSFWVITKVDKIKYHYLCYIDESRKGKISEMLNEPTEEENGTEVIIPIKSRDRYTFEEQTVFATYFWNEKPKLINFKEYSNSSKNFQDKSVLVKKDDFMIIPRRNESHYICIDGIGYRVDYSVINEASKNLKDYSIVLLFNNGELNVSSNRENLQYDEDTIKSVKEKYKIVNAFLENGLRKYFYQASNYLEFADKMFQISQMKYSNNDFDNYNRSIAEYVGYFSNSEKTLKFLSKKFFFNNGQQSFNQNLDLKYHKLQKISKDTDTLASASNLIGKPKQETKDKSRVFKLDIRAFNQSYKDLFYYSFKGRKNDIDVKILKDNNLHHFVFFTPIPYIDYCKWVEYTTNPQKYGLDPKNMKIPFHKLTEEEYNLKIKKEKYQIEKNLGIKFNDYQNIKAEKIVRVRTKVENFKISTIIKTYGKSNTYSSYDSFLSRSNNLIYGVQDQQFYSNPFNKEKDLVYFYEKRDEVEYNNNIDLKMSLWTQLNKDSRIYCIHQRFAKKINPEWQEFKYSYKILEDQFDSMVDLMYLKSKLSQSLIKILIKIYNYLPIDSSLKDKLEKIITLYNSDSKFNKVSEKFSQIISYKRLKPSDEIVYFSSTLISLIGEQFLLFFKLTEDKPTIDQHLGVYFNGTYNLLKDFDYEQHYIDWLDNNKIIVKNEDLQHLNNEDEDYYDDEIIEEEVIEDVSNIITE